MNEEIEKEIKYFQDFMVANYSQEQLIDIARQMKAKQNLKNMDELQLSEIIADVIIKDEGEEEVLNVGLREIFEYRYMDDLRIQESTTKNISRENIMNEEEINESAMGNVPKIDQNEMTDLFYRMNPDLLTEAEDDEGITDEPDDRETDDNEENEKPTAESYKDGVWEDAVDALGFENILEFEEKYDEPTRVSETSFGYGYSVEIGNQEYYVFANHDDAENEAQAYVKDMLKSEPELFNQEFIRRYITMSDTDRRLYAQDDADSYVGDIREDNDGERLIEEASEVDSKIEEEWEDLQEKYNNEEIDQDEYDDSKEKLLDKAEEALSESIYERVYESLEDPYEYFVEEQGIYSPEDFFKQFGNYIDVEEATVDAVSEDGVAHFLSSYDGNENEIGDLYVYRIN